MLSLSLVVVVGCRLSSVWQSKIQISFRRVNENIASCRRRAAFQNFLFANFVCLPCRLLLPLCVRVCAEVVCAAINYNKSNQIRVNNNFPLCIFLATYYILDSQLDFISFCNRNQIPKIYNAKFLSRIRRLLLRFCFVCVCVFVWKSIEPEPC